MTARLKLTPSESAEIGDPVARGTERSSDTAYWSLSSAPGPAENVELSVQLGRLLDQLEPQAGELWRLQGEGWWANWFCYVGSSATEHAAELDRGLLTRLLALPGDLWLDIYPDDEKD